MRGKQDKKEQAVNQRQGGESIKVIASNLGVAVSSVSRWVKNITLTDEQIAKLEERRSSKCSYEAQMAGARANIEKWNSVRKEWRQAGVELVKRERSFRDACLIYWAEGVKSKNNMRIVNSDWRMLGLFVRTMKRLCGVSRIHLDILFYENSECKTWEEAVEFWKSKFDLEIVSIHRRVNDKRDDSGKNKNKLPYGVCEVGFYKSANMVQAIYGGIDSIADE